MANLMITYRCNLNCSYCFANDYVNHDETDMTLDTADRILSWLSQSGEKMVGIMGGEPTIHRHFAELIQLVYDKQMRCSVFTNGLNLKQYLPLIKDVGGKVLINVNEPNVLGSILLETFEEMLADVLRLNMGEQITFGINIYHADYDLSYVINLLKRFHHHELRVALAVPNIEPWKQDVLEHLSSYLPMVRNLLDELHEINVIPTFDCNRIPACLLRSAGFDKLPYLEDLRGKTNLFEAAIPCSPVIDILPDMTAIRCFGLSDETRVDIHEFKSIRHLRRYYQETIDWLCRYTPASQNCQMCYEHKAGLCHGGCLTYHLDKINKLQQILHSESRCEP